MNFKHIPIGTLIQQLASENEVGIVEICNFLQCSKKEVELMYQAESLDTEVILQWSKLLKYDFFRIYSKHLIVYASLGASSDYKYTPEKQSAVPGFRKSIYTPEIIEFVLELIETGEKSKRQIIEEYRIPETTLHKWMDRNKK
ncbi:transposase [Chryseobacterium phosphatilyticum]|uniref:Transposase n=1 Tax=Chryseobacterium phosphatilyticum TaxID=475075 RepID=A0A316XBP6_9FLAO|nr:transposase [Chryseobacterium phosphatilyticum]PWN71117.1 transposase [Chryseobacterium phosphatilyticum]